MSVVPREQHAFHVRRLLRQRPHLLLEARHAAIRRQHDERIAAAARSTSSRASPRGAARRAAGGGYDGDGDDGVADDPTRSIQESPRWIVRRRAQSDAVRSADPHLRFRPGARRAAIATAAVRCPARRRHRRHAPHWEPFARADPRHRPVFREAIYARHGANQERAVGVVPAQRGDGVVDDSPCARSNIGHPLPPPHTRQLCVNQIEAAVRAGRERATASRRSERAHRRINVSDLICDPIADDKRAALAPDKDAGRRHRTCVDCAECMLDFRSRPDGAPQLRCVARHREQRSARCNSDDRPIGVHQQDGGARHRELRTAPRHNEWIERRAEEELAALRNDNRVPLRFMQRSPRSEREALPRCGRR